MAAVIADHRATAAGKREGRHYAVRIRRIERGIANHRCRHTCDSESARTRCGSRVSAIGDVVPGTVRCLWEERYVVRRCSTKEFHVAVAARALPRGRLHQATCTIARENDRTAVRAGLEVEARIKRRAGVVVGAGRVHYDDMPMLRSRGECATNIAG